MGAQLASESSSTRGSKWKYAIAFVPVSYLVALLAAAYVVGSAVLGSGGLSMSDPVTVSLIVIVSILLFLGTVALPYALYRDISLFELDERSNWDPNRTTYVLTAAFGFFVPGLSAAVSLHYLYHRRNHVRHS